MENRKERVIKILKRVAFIVSLCFNAIFIFALIIGGVASKKKGSNVSCALAESPIQEKIEFKQDNKKYVSYNDEDNIITLNSSELTNYTFENFIHIVNEDLSGFSACSFYYNDTVYEYSDDADGALELVSAQSDYIFVIYDADIYNSANGKDYKNYIFLHAPSWEYDLEIMIPSIDYASAKSAMELDIEENTKTINDGIFETLTESTVAFISSIGSGIGYMTAIFYDSANSQLTTIGLLSVIVVAVSLSYFLFRLIIGLIRMRG